VPNVLFLTDIFSLVKVIGSSDTNMLKVAYPVHLQKELIEALALNVRQMLFRNLE